MAPFSRHTLLAALLLLLIIAPVGCQTQASPLVTVLDAPADGAQAAPVVYWPETWEEPRPVRLHFIRVDLTSDAVEPRAILAQDPDADGPAEAALTLPLELAQSASAIAAVNANFFRHLPTATEEEKKRGWYQGLHVDICGLAAAEDKLVSESESSFAGFWIDAGGAPHVGVANDASTIADGVSGLLLLKAGENVREAGGALHPRTLVGLDADRRFMLIVVADGRRPGYSEGVSLYECAEVMADHGCVDAVNLDGGGSTIMLLQDDPESPPRTMNRPSGLFPRPIPVMLGVCPS